MGALRNTLPSSHPVERKNYTYDRDRLRKSAGYGITPDAAFADLPRLSRGQSFVFLVLGILRYAGFESGAKSQPGRKANAWTEAIPDQFWADVCGADVRELQRNFDYGTRAKVIEREKVGASHSRLRLRLEDWPALPDYKVWLAASLQVVEKAESDDEPITDDPAANELTDIRLLRAPGKVKPGRVCKPMKIETGVKSLSLDWSKVPSLPVGLMYDPQIKAGQLIVHLALDQSVSKKVAGEHKANTKRHECRSFTKSSPKIRHYDKRRTNSENFTCVHPKSLKLCEIFNPILERFRLPMLETSQKALQAACEAMGDLSTNDLIEFLGKGRANRAISSHRHVALIIGDARRDRDARAKLPEDERVASEAEIERLIAAERAARKKGGKR